MLCDELTIFEHCSGFERNFTSPPSCAQSWTKDPPVWACFGMHGSKPLVWSWEVVFEETTDAVASSVSCLRRFGCDSFSGVASVKVCPERVRLRRLEVAGWSFHGDGARSLQSGAATTAHTVGGARQGSGCLRNAHVYCCVPIFFKHTARCRGPHHTDQSKKITPNYITLFCPDQY